MGVSAGGVSIKTDTGQYQAKDIANALLGRDLVQADSYEDTRRPGCYSIVKTPGVITIYNADFAERFFRRRDDGILRQVLDYFHNPSLVMAHEWYDSGGTYSYAIIRDGVCTRRFSSESYETTIDSGEPEEVEKAWFAGEIKNIDNEDDDIEKIRVHPVTGRECIESQLPQVLLGELLSDLLGLAGDPDQVIERTFFSLAKPGSKPASTQPGDLNLKTRKPWWKLW